MNVLKLIGKVTGNLINEKADKPQSSTENSIPRLDSDGNLKSSGVIVSDDDSVDGLKLSEVTFNEFYTGLLTSGVYVPYVNYTWNDTKQVNNVMYSRNVGVSGSDLELHSGQGAKFNGTDQSVKIPSSKLPTVDGLSTWSYIISIDNTANSNRGKIFLPYFCNVSIERDEQNTLKLTEDDSDLGRIDTDLMVIGDYKGSIYVGYENDIIYIYKDGMYFTEYPSPSPEPIYLDKLYVGGVTDWDQYSEGSIKDVYIFNDILTQQEISLYSSNPNQFFDNVRDGIIDNCVLNMPMDGNDKYLKDYVNYSESAELFNVNNVTFDSGGVNYWTDDGNGTYTLSQTDSSNTPFLSTHIALTEGELYYIDVELNETTGDIQSDNLYNFYNISGKYKGIISCINTTSSLSFKRFGAPAYGSIKINSIKHIVSGIHEIENYTASCRDEAKQLTYGSQEANYTHNNVGFRDMPSEYFEGSKFYDSYGDTGWIPTNDENWSIEIIQEQTNDGSYHISGRNESPDARIYFGENNSGRFCTRYLNSNPILIDSTNRDVGYIVISSNFSDGTMKIYSSGNYLGEYDISSFVNFTESIILGVELLFTQSVKNPIRLFKVHKKALTQQEVTDNYNSYLSQGLLDA